MEKTNKQIAMKVSWNTIIVNVLLSIFKVIAGVLGNSAAMLSDAVHSLSDVLSTFIVMIGIKLANKKADKEHPYGHERFECVAAIILAAILCATGFGIGYGGIQTILAGNYSKLTIPSILALIAATLSIVIKEGMYWYTRAAAKKINSGALMADAWHHRSDAMSSIGSFIGILGARMGFPVLDSIACLVICLFILKASYDIFMDAINKMIDKACDSEMEEEIRSLILKHEDVIELDLLQTRFFGDKIYVDVEVSVDGNRTLLVSHQVAEAIHDSIEQNFSKVKHCMVHLNPYIGNEEDISELVELTMEI